MVGTLTDEGLIDHYLSRYPTTCYELLYRRHVDKVYGHCLRFTRDSQQAQDYTHDVFLKVFDKLTCFQHRARFSSWLYSITHNYCLDQLRRANRLRTVKLNEGLIQLVDDAGVWQLDEEQLLVFRQALMNLPLEEQILLRLKYEQGLSLRELAQLYGLKMEVVKMRLKRSRSKVQQLYHKQQLSDQFSILNKLMLIGLLVLHSGLGSIGYIVE